jgi:hypothetical protein
MSREDVTFWRWAVMSGGTAVAAFLGFFGMILFFPGAILLIAAVAVATKLEDLE